MDESAIIPEDLKVRYSDFRPIGAGGMGRVYRAYDNSLLKDVAIKLLTNEGGISPDATVRFQKEAQSASKLQHMRLVSVMDFGIAGGGQPYLVMEYVLGKPLSSILEDRQVLPLWAAVEIVCQICEGMRHVHDHAIVHRDLKPSNIIVLNGNIDEPSIKIVDFGVAKMARTSDTAGSTTDPNDLVGTPNYMSPEQVKGLRVDRRADIYAVGAILFNLLTGAHPFPGKSSLEILQGKTSRPAPRISDVDNSSSVPASIQDIVARCLETNPDQRYDNMAELLSALEEACQQEEVQTEIERQTRSSAYARIEDSKRSRRMTVIVVIASIGLSLSLVAGFLQYKRLSVARAPAPPVRLQNVGGPVLFDEAEPEPSRIETLFDISNRDTTWDAKKEITDDVLAKITKFPIRKLKLEFNTQVSDEGMRYVAQIKTLQELNIAETHVGDPGFAYLCQSKSLIILDAVGTNISDKSMPHLAGSSIQNLNLQQTNISDEGLAFIGKKADLVELKLSGNAITDSGIKSISNLPLEGLNLEACAISDDALLEISKLKRLKRLYIGSSKATEKGLAGLAGCPLEELSLEGCPNVDDRCVALVKHWPKLTTFNVSGSRCTSHCLKDIVRLSELDNLGLIGLGLHDQDLNQLLLLKKLEYLHLENNPLTEKCLAQTISKMASLKEVTLNGCNILSSAIDKFHVQYPRLKVVYRNDKTLTPFLEFQPAE